MMARKAVKKAAQSTGPNAETLSIRAQKENESEADWMDRRNREPGEQAIANLKRARENAALQQPNARD